MAALLLSAVTHALVLGLRFDVPLAPPGGVSQTGQAGRHGSIMRAIDVAITPDATPENVSRVDGGVPTQLRETDRVDAVSRATDDPSTSSDAEVGRPNGTKTRTGRDRAAPRMTDRRLWFEPVHRPATDAGEAESIRAPVRERVAALNDSIAAEEERARQAADWTARDEQGGRWGISPDRLHLGGLTVKLRHCTVEPCEGWLLPTPADRKDEYANRQRGFAEIRLQAARAELGEALAGRAEAIRKRMAAQRDSSRSGRP